VSSVLGLLVRILFGHPTGNPNSHHAALAHYEAGRLEALVVAWFPSRAALAFLQMLPPTRAMGARLERRRLEPLASAPKVQGRLGELRRLAIRACGMGSEALSYEANDWLMHTMARECRRPSVTAVHAYEDCSLWQFKEAKRRGKACIYDMPIGYYPAWEQTQRELAKRFADWLPSSGLSSNQFVRPEQKRKEMELADLVLVPSTFVRQTVGSFLDKQIALAGYGVDAEFWSPGRPRRTNGPMRFIYAGQISIRKGIPVLFEAWRKAELRDSELDLVGSWLLAEEKRRSLPQGIHHIPPCSRTELRERYRGADLLVFPSFFEGFGLVILEAMACGLPVIATNATAGPDLLTNETGTVFEAGDMDALVHLLRWFSTNRDQLPAMKRAARAQAERCTWEHYRTKVTQAVAATFK
jgi:starch synthase